MEPVTSAALIAGAASAIGSGAQAYAQGKMNRKTRKFAKWQMETQRKWSLEDWERQNAYNSPAQQMQRLKEAGLNPHLIYNSGSPTQNASPIGSTPNSSWNPETPNIGQIMTSPVNSYLAMRSFDANQKLISAQTLKTLADVDTKNFDLTQKQRLADTQASIMTEVLAGKQIQNQATADENARRAVMQTSNLAEAAQRIAKSLSDIELQDMMKQKGNEEITSIRQMRRKINEEIHQMQKDGKIKDFEIALNKAGLTKSDPLYARLAKLAADAAGLSPEAIKQKVQELSTQAGEKAKEINTAIQYLLGWKFLKPMWDHIRTR